MHEFTKNRVNGKVFIIIPFQNHMIKAKNILTCEPDMKTHRQLSGVKYWI